MAKYWLRLFILIACVVGFFALVGSLLPRSYDFETSTVISAPKERVFLFVNSLKKWPEWSEQWNTEKIEELTINYNNIEEGAGAAQTWTDRRGDGKLWITEVTPNESVKFDMTFSNFPVMKSEYKLESVEVDGITKTKVTWTSKGSLPSGPMYGFLAPLFPGQMTYEYEKSLAALKLLAESSKD